MPIFVVEVGGGPVLAFNENLSREADAFVLSAPFRDNLLTRKRGGSPLWDGKAEIKVRDASAAERTVWQTSQVANDPGCVKTPTSQESAELFSY